MDYYCRKSVEFMQTQPQCKYNLICSKKRTREPEKQGETTPQVVPPNPDKGKGKLHPDPLKTGVLANKESNSPKGHTKKEAHVPMTTTNKK